MERMKVVEPDGSIGDREIDYVERYDGSTQLVRPRAVPVLADGEDLHWVMGETMPTIVKLRDNDVGGDYDYVYTQ